MAGLGFAFASCGFPADEVKSISYRVVELKDLFERARVKVDLHDDIRVGIWQKFMIICALSGLGGVTRAPQGGTLR